jgi:hypothetical protein
MLRDATFCSSTKVVAGCNNNAHLWKYIIDETVQNERKLSEKLERIARLTGFFGRGEGKKFGKISLKVLVTMVTWATS